MSVFSLSKLIESAENYCEKRKHRLRSWGILGENRGQKAISCCIVCGGTLECLTNPEKGESPFKGTIFSSPRCGESDYLTLANCVAQANTVY